MDQIELRYQAARCRLQAESVVDSDVAGWLRELGAKLALMADTEDSRSIFYACQNLAEAD